MNVFACNSLALCINIRTKTADSIPPAAIGSEWEFPNTMKQGVLMRTEPARVGIHASVSPKFASVQIYSCVCIIV